VLLDCVVRRGTSPVEPLLWPPLLWPLLWGVGRNFWVCV
jgi:hypothetical protein